MQRVIEVIVVAKPFLEKEAELTESGDSSEVVLLVGASDEGEDPTADFELV